MLDSRGHVPVWVGSLLNPPTPPIFRACQGINTQDSYPGQPAVGDHDPGTDKKMYQILVHLAERGQASVLLQLLCWGALERSLNTAAVVSR